MTEVNEPIGRLYAAAGHLVLRRCVQILRDREEALDVVQWTFVRAIEVGFEVRSQPEALAWLYQTASRRCLQLLRGGSTRTRLLDRHRVAMESLPTIHHDDRLVDRDLLTRALAELSDADAQMALMTYVWGFDVEHVAQIVSVSERTVRRAREAFQRGLVSLTQTEELS
jgi:RNA polymerase sigma factor (sigma-70 family)